MIVIPPCSHLEEYFSDLARRAWAISLEKESDMCESLKSENKTLILSSFINQDDSTNISFILHYRYFKGELYCFVEEIEDEVA